MNDHLEELIHDGIDQLTAGSTLPAGLAARARQKVRRRQYQLRATFGAGTAAAAAIAVIAATSAGSAGQPSSPSSSIVLLAKVEQAVASKAGSGPVLRVKTTFFGGQDLPTFDPFTAVPLYPGGKARTEFLWAQGNVVKFELLNPKGQVVIATRSAGRPNLRTSTTVNYADRIWSRSSISRAPVKATHSCRLMMFGPTGLQEWSPPDLALEIRHAVACGRAKLAGRQMIGGVDAIRLTFSSGSFYVTWNRAAAHATARQIMWIDPHSYLPLRYRSTLTIVHAGPGSGHQTTSVQSDFLWLIATKSALAKLQLTVPSGFRHAREPVIYAPIPRNP